MFLHRNIHTVNWTSPDEMTHNQIDLILVEARRNSSVIELHLFRAADCYSNHYLVVEKDREKLEVSKQRICTYLLRRGLISSN
jgi:hypothetical protein